MTNNTTRRQFLTQASLSLTALAMASRHASAQQAQTTATAEAQPESEKVGWAIAGLGVFATGPILKNIHHCQKTRVTGLVTRDPDGKGQKFAAEYGVDTAAVVKLEDMHRLADRKDIEVVYVITPNGLHKEYALAALAAGKHVFCEKPYANSAAECEEINAAAKKAGKLVGLGYRVRFDPGNILAIDTIKSGDLGKVKTISGEYGFNLNTSHPAGAWRADLELAGGGSLADIGVYGVNAACFLTGETPTHVTGHTFSTPGDPRFTEVEETCLFQFQFPSGIQFQGMSSYGIAGTGRCRAIGNEGWLEMEPAIAYEGAQLVINKKGRKKPELDKANMFAAMMDDFSDAVRTGRQPRSTGEDGLRDMQLIDAIYQSAREGGKIIAL